MAWKLPNISKAEAAHCAKVACCNLFGKMQFRSYKEIQAPHREGTHRHCLDLRPEPAAVAWERRRIPGLSLYAEFCVWATSAAPGAASKANAAAVKGETRITEPVSENKGKSRKRWLPCVIRKSQMTHTAILHLCGVLQKKIFL